MKSGKSGDESVGAIAPLDVATADERALQLGQANTTQAVLVLDAAAALIAARAVGPAAVQVGLGAVGGGVAAGGNSTDPVDGRRHRWRRWDHGPARHGGSD